MFKIKNNKQSLKMNFFIEFLNAMCITKQQGWHNVDTFINNTYGRSTIGKLKHLFGEYPNEYFGCCVTLKRLFLLAEKLKNNSLQNAIYDYVKKKLMKTTANKNRH
eukprot:gb/GECH01010720.1/.p1 GENE.gb/GECH01010720.1/~~gb/GECH01010720.1/.p1  ORF type:complete len:106 (+),score=4.71 gb/GECH01010720.1/:1-318(+)